MYFHNRPVHNVSASTVQREVELPTMKAELRELVDEGETRLAQGEARVVG